MTVRKRTVVFDMDGTLVDSEELAWRSAVDGLSEIGAAVPAREELRSWVGLPSLEYFARLAPGADPAEVRRRVAGHEVRRLAAGEGRLYPGALETLDFLHREWKLALVSNCGRLYLDANLRYLLEDRFDAAFCLDDRPTKTENVRAALERLGASTGVMVGDRAADLEAGRANGLRTVGCTYGFGATRELAGADWRISSLAELPRILGVD